MNLLKEQILKYAGIITEDLTPQQVGSIIQKFLSTDTNEEIFKRLDIATSGKWFSKLNFSEKEKSFMIKVTPLNTLSNENIKELVLSNVLPQNKNKVANIFNLWIKNNLQNLISNYKNWTISYIDPITKTEKILGKH